MQTLDERLAELRETAAACSKDAEMCRRKAADFEQQAMIIEAEIRGIETARAALAPPAGAKGTNGGAEPPRTRQPKRDIKALVRGLLTEDEVGFACISGLDTFPEARTDQIAQEVGCKPYRVRAIVESLRND